MLNGTQAKVHSVIFPWVSDPGILGHDGESKCSEVSKWPSVPNQRRQIF